MAVFSDELMMASPFGEAQHGFGKSRSSQDERDQQRADFGNRQGNQVGDPFFRRDRLRACVRITTSIARASNESVMSPRAQPIYEPFSVFALSQVID